MRRAARRPPFPCPSHRSHRCFTSTPPTVPAWQGVISVGDVVSFRFPRRERPYGWAKARPCLVLAVDHRDDGPHALLAYGTAQFTLANRGHEIGLIKDAELAIAGVERPMRFVCARRVWARFDDPRFSCGADRGSPRLGRLDGTARSALADILAALPRRGGRVPATNHTTKGSN